MHVPLFCTFQVFVNDSLGFNTVPAGTVTSLINNRLLHPEASNKGLAVAVYCVPVGEGDALTVEITGTNTFVDEGAGEGKESGVFVGVDDVDNDVCVAGGANAVCVSKIEAARVPTPAVRMSFTFTSGGGVAPPHETINTLASKTFNKDLFLKFVFPRKIFMRE